MRLTLAKLLLATAAFIAPAQAAPFEPAPACAGVYCATLPSGAERMALVAYLADRKDDPLAACDALAGARRTGCAVLQGMVADAWRVSTYRALSTAWGGEASDAFARLLVAEEAFARAVGENETDHLSAESGADAIAAQQAEKNAFLGTLRKVADGRLAHPSLVAFADVDGALNAAYAQVMAVGDTSNLAWGSVDKAGIRRTERAWLVYRDAFVAFAETLDPSAVDLVKTELTQRRMVSLEGFLED